MEKVIPYALYDEVMMKKPHPCEGRCRRFQIVRVGADIKIQCLSCGNLILMSRDDFNHKVLRVLASHLSPIYQAK